MVTYAWVRRYVCEYSCIYKEPQVMLWTRFWKISLIVHRWCLEEEYSMDDSLSLRSKWIPGWDCHGLPIENKALQKLEVNAHMIHISSFDPCILKKDSYSVDPIVIRDTANATALREIDSQKKEFSSLAIMADWKSEGWTYRTLGKKAFTRPSLHQPIG